MKNTNQEFPDEIISLLLHQNWHDLNDYDRELVKLYFSPETYDVLHQAMQIKQVDVQSPKEKLMHAFDKRHQTTLRIGNNSFKIAAIIMLFGVAALQLIILMQHKGNKLVTQIIRDTVMVQQYANTQPIYTYDTVYLTQEYLPKPVYKTERNNGKVYTHKKTVPIQPIQPDVHIVSIDALNEVPNIRRKNSIKSDSVYQRMSFVTL